MSTDIWIVLRDDRHGDTEALPFSSEKQAVGFARARGGRDGVPLEELTDAMRAEGWVFVLPYGTEGDRFRVIRRTMDTGRISG